MLRQVTGSVSNSHEGRMREVQGGSRPKPQRLGEALAPPVLEILSLAGLAGFYWFAQDVLDEDGHVVTNLIGPLAMAAILGVFAWRMVRAEARNIWTALFWFRASTGFYFGLGTSFVFAMNAPTRSYIESFHHFVQDDILKLNLIVSVSTVV